jgi:hypothetical protein
LQHDKNHTIIHVATGSTEPFFLAVPCVVEAAQTFRQSACLLFGTNLDAKPWPILTMLMMVAASILQCDIGTIPSGNDGNMKTAVAYLLAIRGADGILLVSLEDSAASNCLLYSLSAKWL